MTRPVAVRPVAVRPVAPRPVAPRPVAVRPVAVRPVAVRPVAPAPPDNQRSGPVPELSRRSRRRIAAAAGDQRGDYAVFIAIIVTALLFLGGLAYDGPRVIAARQDAAHAANEAARVAAATIAAGGTLHQAQEAAQHRVGGTGLIYGQDVDVVDIECVGSRVQVYIASRYVYRSAMRLMRSRQTITAVGAAEAVLVLPGGQDSTRHYLGECPLL